MERIVREILALGYIAGLFTANIVWLLFTNLK